MPGGAALARVPGVLLAAVGGAAGALARHALAVAAPLGPGGTLLVANVLGCLLLGLLAGRTRDPALRALLGTGVLGGFTTMSAVTVEPVGWVLVGSLGGGIAAAALGLRLGQKP